MWRVVEPAELAEPLEKLQRNLVLRANGFEKLLFGGITARLVHRFDGIQRDSAEGAVNFVKTNQLAFKLCSGLTRNWLWHVEVLADTLQKTFAVSERMRLISHDVIQLLRCDAQE